MLLMSQIVTVAARKGGVGKTTLAYELAWLLDAPLVDLEFDEGSATRMWGYRHETRVRALLLDALDSGRTPHPLAGYHKPDLVPCHPDFQLNQPPPDEMADVLVRWMGEWGRDFVVVDTHGGGSPSGDGAIAAASVVVVPVPLKTKDLNATEGMVREMPDYPIVIVPNMVPRVPRAAEIRRVAQIVDGTPVTVAEPVPYVRGIETRKKRVAITSDDPTPKAYQGFVDSLHSLAGFVKAHGS
jgi:chromosome partitioning protein